MEWLDESSLENGIQINYVKKSSNTRVGDK